MGPAEPSRSRPAAALLAGTRAACAIDGSAVMTAPMPN
jgi:hypothetical protein